jgi:hypothetical protein
LGFPFRDVPKLRGIIVIFVTVGVSKFLLVVFVWVLPVGVVVPATVAAYDICAGSQVDVFMRVLGWLLPLFENMQSTHTRKARNHTPEKHAQSKNIDMNSRGRVSENGTKVVVRNLLEGFLGCGGQPALWSDQRQTVRGFQIWVE